MEIVIIHDHPRPGIWCKTSHPHRKIKKGHSRLRRMTVRFLVSKKKSGPTQGNDGVHSEIQERAVGDPRKLRVDLGQSTWRLP